MGRGAGGFPEEADEVVRRAAGHGGQLGYAVLGTQVHFHVVQHQLQGGAVQPVGEAAAVLFFRQARQLGAQQDQEELAGHELHPIGIGQLLAEDAEELLEAETAQHREAGFLPLPGRMLEGGQQRLGEGPFQEERGEAEGGVGVVALQRVPEAGQQQGQIAGSDDPFLPVLPGAHSHSMGGLEQGPGIACRKDLRGYGIALKDGQAQGAAGVGEEVFGFRVAHGSGIKRDAYRGIPARMTGKFS